MIRKVSMLCALAIYLVVANSGLMTQEQSDAILAVHVVQRGENLFRVALQYDLFPEEVAKANGITDFDSLAVGQRLIIPLVGDVPQPTVTHTVVAGDTLENIAAFYGRNVSDLLALNDLSLESIISVGQVLVIVSAEENVRTAEALEDEIAAATATPTVAGRNAESAGGIGLILGGPDFTFVHTVRAGDTVYDIGVRYSQTVSALATINNLQDPTTIHIGQELVIPGIEPPRLLRELPEIVTSFTLEPLIFEEGRSGRIRISTSEPVTLSGTFLDTALRFIDMEAGKQQTALIGIPMFTEQSQFPLLIRVEGADGLSATIEANLQVIGGGYGYQNITIDNSELLAPAVEEEEARLLARVTGGFTAEKRWNQSLSLPAAAAMNAVFGTLRSYNGSPYNRYHSGVDFAGATGTSVLAAADGQVVLADTLHIRGKTLAIDHGWGVYTVYAHQDSLLVSLGDMVESGQMIGTIGSTGRSTGPHLHWEVWVNGVNVDPMQWVQERFP